MLSDGGNSLPIQRRSVNGAGQWYVMSSHASNGAGVGGAGYKVESQKKASDWCHVALVASTVIVQEG